jgi:hypothetical protein
MRKDDAMNNSASNNGERKELTPEAAQALLSDAQTVAFLKSFLAIPDEVVKAKIRRLVKDLSAQAAKQPDAPKQGAEV